jgi:hypothetical protein
VIPLVIVLTYIASSEEWMGKQVLEVEVGPNTLVLILMKKKNRVEVGYETIKSMLISTDPLDHPKMIFLVLDHPTGSGKDRLPYLFLRGFEGMDRLALELGKKIPDPKSVTRAHVEADQSKMFRFQLKFWVAIVGVLALMAVAIFLFLKSGQGRLLVPLLLIISGLFQFAGAKGKRNDRWLGIVFIIGGLLWGAFKLLEPLLNR